MRTAHRLPAVVLGAAIIVGSVLLAGPAQAHDYVVASTPAEGAVVSEPPSEFSVTMNENVLDIAGDGSGSGIQVTDAAGRYYGDGCVTVAGATVSMPATLGDAGAYRLVWQLVSSDGHPTNGEFSFTWDPAAGVETVEGSATPPVCGEEVGEEVTAETPEPTATAEAPVDVPADEPAGSADWLVWGGIALGVTALAVASALLLTRRRPKE